MRLACTKVFHMNILIYAIGTRGDVQPFVALGRVLAARGHKVTLAAPSGFADMIETAGLAHYALPFDVQEMLETPEIRDALTSWRGKLRAYRWAGEAMNAHLSAMWQAGLEVAPDLILNHFKGALAPYLARRLGAVSIPVMLQPGFVATRDYPQWLIATRTLGGFANLASHRLIMAVMRAGTAMMIRRWKKATRTDIGPRMDPFSGVNPHGPAPRIHAYSPTLCPRDATWPRTEAQTGYLFSDPEGFTAPNDLAAFLAAGAAPVYVGFGSMPGMDHERINRALLGALKRTGQRAVVATGWGGFRDLDGSDDVHVLQSVPHSWLFPRVSAVVHHGGSGTTHEGLRWGRASVICPLFADQPFFGAQVAGMGAGPAPIKQKKLSAGRLAGALEMALSDEVKSRAATLGEAIRQENGVARAVDVIEVAGKAPR